MIKVNLNNDEIDKAYKDSIREDGERDDMLVDEEKESDDIEVNLENNFSNNLSKTKNEDTSNYRPILFKNYLPIDENLQVDKLPYFDTIEEIEKNYEKKVKKSVKEFLNIEKNPLNIVPKKNNIDLKRNLAKKLEKLNRKTEIAIMEIIKENIEKQKKEMELESDKNYQEDITGSKLLMTTNMQMNMQEEALKKEYFNEEDEGEISSDYDKGINE